MKNKLLKVTCKRNRAYYEEENSSVTLSFFCLVDLSNIDKDITDFTIELNDQTKLDWTYKDICGRSENYILVVNKEFDIEHEIPDEIIFHVRTDFTPRQCSYITEIE